MVVVFTATILSAAGYQFIRRTLENAIKERLSIVAADRQANLLNYIQQQQERVGQVAARNRLRRLVELADSHPDDEADIRIELTSILTDVRETTPSFLLLNLADPDGHVIASTDPHEVGTSASGTRDFQLGEKSRHFGLLHREGDQCRAWLAAPVMPRGESRLLGVVLVLLDASSLEKMLTHPEGLGSSGGVVVVRREGDKIYNLLTPGMPGLDAQQAPASAAPRSGTRASSNRATAAAARAGGLSPGGVRELGARGPG